LEGFKLIFDLLVARRGRGRTPLANRARLCAVIVLLLASQCTPSTPAVAPPPASTLPASAVAAAATAEPQPIAPAAAGHVAPMIIRGNGALVKASGRVATAPAAIAPDGQVSLNFVNADIRDVARAVLGDALHLNYAVDPRLQTTVTVETAHPLAPQAVLPALEIILRASGVALVQVGDIYRLEPLEDAARAARVGVDLGGSDNNRPGYGIEVLPLHFIAAAEMAKIIEPFLPPGAVLQQDAARNILIVSGTRQDLDNFSDLVRSFDVNILAGMSVAIFPLQVSSPSAVASELTRIFREGSGGSLASMVRVVPIERLNAILVMSSQAAYLEQARSWIERLDYGSDETTPQLYQYFVQNSRATDLASVLAQIFGGNAVGTVKAPTVQANSGIDLGTAFPGASATAVPSSGMAAKPETTQQSPLAAAPSSPSTPPVPEVAGLVAATNAAPGDDGGLPKLRIVADEKNNALIIFAKPRDYRMIAATIKKLDIVPLQIVIDATIAEVTLNDELQYGLQYFLQNGANSETFSNAMSGGVAAVFPGFNYVLATQKASVVLSALASVSHVNVISSPHLMVLDHQTAVLQVGDQVPVPVQQQQSTITPGAPVIDTINYVDTGVILRVTPRVNASGLIMLDISQEVSNVTATTSSSLNAPTIEQRRIQSSISIQDGETLALGGLITDTKSRTRNGIPLLADVPVLGPLFRFSDDTKARTELLVLLSPRVVRNAQQARQVTDELRRRMHGLTSLDTLVQ
jgi:general secretion pathway protein D